MHLSKANLFSSSLAIKNTKKIETEIKESATQMRLNLRQSGSRSRERIYSNAQVGRGDDAYKSGERS